MYVTHHTADIVQLSSHSTVPAIGRCRITLYTILITNTVKVLNTASSTVLVQHTQYTGDTRHNGLQ